GRDRAGRRQAGRARAPEAAARQTGAPAAGPAETPGDVGSASQRCVRTDAEVLGDAAAESRGERHRTGAGEHWGHGRLTTQVTYAAPHRKMRPTYGETQTRWAWQHVTPTA